MQEANQFCIKKKKKKKKIPIFEMSNSIQKSTFYKCWRVKRFTSYGCRDCLLVRCQRRIYRKGDQNGDRYSRENLKQRYGKQGTSIFDSVQQEIEKVKREKVANQHEDDVKALKRAQELEQAMHGMQHGVDVMTKEQQYEKERVRREPQSRFLDKSDQLYLSAERLKKRLEAAIDAESEAQTQATLDLYKSAKVSRLVRDGLVLLGLKMEEAGELHGSLVYKFMNVLGGDLGYHRFNKGATIVVSPASLTVSGRGKKDIEQIEMTTAEGIVLEVRKDYVKAAFEEDTSEILESMKGKLRMDQCMKDVTVKRQRAALKQLFLLRDSNSALEYTVRKIILGLPGVGHDSRSTKPQWVCEEKWRAAIKHGMSQIESLNQSQQQAIATALTRSFTLWQGPPGTGKTSALISLLELVCHANEIIRDSNLPNAWCTTGKILVCADTNAATDNLVEGLMSRGLSVVRLGNPAKVREELRGVTLDSLAEQTNDGKRAVAMRSRGRQQLKTGENRHGAKKLLKEADELIKEAALRVLDDVDIVASTCAGCGEDTIKHHIFRFVIVDESTQTTEPTVLIPLLKGAECVVMAGDPLQLPPTVISTEAHQYALQRSMFERLESTGLKPLLLNTQYRMHPGIAYFPNQWFYHGLLKSGITNKQRPMPGTLPWPNPRLPVMMLECEHGKDQKASADGQGLSYINSEEAKLVMKVLWTVTQGSTGVQDVVLLTPYKGQVRLLEQLRRAIQEYLPMDVNVSVSSVDGYQGREAEVVIFSTVRANKQNTVGFLRDPRRLNVAITRARSGLVVVGSPQTLKSSNDWYNWLQWIKANKAFQYETAFPVAPWEEESEGVNIHEMIAEVELEEETEDFIINVDDSDSEDNGVEEIRNKKSLHSSPRKVTLQYSKQTPSASKHHKATTIKANSHTSTTSELENLRYDSLQDSQQKDNTAQNGQPIMQGSGDSTKQDYQKNEDNIQVPKAILSQEELQKLTVEKLKKLCQSSQQLEIKGISKMKKQQLISEILKYQNKIDESILISMQ
eukprot:TRINITY_DN11411_c0_g1_i8.p1 TRINITY_DN11411_c0_g1~~TRINITY_DN11411_c0_g1_i8.p1  ORF type:complete len:1025 (-),score=122.83 TRINITY_DN11411_c0_g1_i8:579-3653(-)